eukprot:956842_1
MSSWTTGVVWKGEASRSKLIDVSSASGKAELLGWKTAKEALAADTTVSFPRVLLLTEIHEGLWKVVVQEHSMSLLNFAESKFQRKMRKSTYSLEKRLKCLVGCCTALGKLHESGVAHGDIHPRNCLLTKKKLLLMDFDKSTSAEFEDFEQTIHKDLQDFGGVIFAFCGLAGYSQMYDLGLITKWRNSIGGHAVLNSLADLVAELCSGKYNGTVTDLEARLQELWQQQAGGTGEVNQESA